MTTLTVNISDEKDLPLLKEILNRFGLSYKVEEDIPLSKEDKLYKKLKQSFKDVKEWEAGKLKLQDAKQALAEIEAGLQDKKKPLNETNKGLLNMIFENREKAPVISENIDIRGLIDNTHYH